MKSTIALLFVVLVAGCAGPEGRVKMVTFDSSERPPASRVDVFQPGEMPPNTTKAIALLTVEGHANEEVEAIEGMLARCRRLGADALVILEPESPNANLRFRGGLAGPRPSYRIFRGNAVRYE